MLEHIIDEPDTLPVNVPLEIETINLNLAENRRSHHTDSYDVKGLVVRRGQSFSLTLSSKNPLTAGVCVCVCVCIYVFGEGVLKIEVPAFSGLVVTVYVHKI